MFTDNSSIIFSDSDSTDYATEFIVTFDTINLWFAISSLSLNLNKINYVHFTAKWSTKSDINNNFEGIQINNIYNITFLGLIIGGRWKKQIEQLAPRLSSVGYSVRSLKSIMSQKSLRTIYFSYVHSTMS